MTKIRNLTTGQVAKYCGVNHRTVLRWIKEGYIKAYQLPGRGDNRVKAEDCVAFFRQHEIPIPEELVDFNHEDKILIIEDDETMAKLMKKILMHSGYEVQVVTDSFQAGATLTTFRPQALILDLNMPNIPGMEILKFVRQDDRFQDLKILVVSAMSEQHLNDAMSAGATGTLSKPFDANEFKNKVSELFSS
jgi:excisionase family DNA binding protein